MSIRARILTAVLVALASAVLIAGIGLAALREYRGNVDELRGDSQRAFYGERLNRLVTHVVMEARGIYAAADAKAAEPFGVGLLKTLDEIDAVLRAWSPLVEPEHRAAFERIQKQAAEFRTFRSETVRLAREVSTQAANAQGNNEANRANRKNFQAAIDELVVRDQKAFAQDIERADEIYASAVQLLWVAAAVALVLGCALALYIAIALVSRPLVAVTSSLQRVTAGHDDIAMPEKLGGDELSELWRVVAEFRDARRDQEQLRAQQARDKAQAEAEQRAALVAVADTFEASVGSIIGSVSETAQRLLQEAEGMKSVSQVAAQSSSTAAAASDQTNASVHSVAGATEEMSASISEISQRLAHAADLIGTAAGRIATSDADVLELARSADRIGSMASTIRDIAEQTNLLALNATIEAARAGEAGRGFAVVAQEVKALAEQTSKATQDIEQQIAAIQQATSRTVNAMGEFSQQIQELNHVASQVAAATEQQGAVSREIARNISEAAVGTGATARSLTELSAVAGRSGEAAERVFEFAGDLSRESKRLRSEVTTVLTRIRA